MKHQMCVAAFVVLVPMVAIGQDRAAAPQPGKEKIVVVGCVERGQVNGSLAGTGVGTTSPSPNTADDDANSQQLVDRFMLTGATIASRGDANPSQVDSGRNEARPGGTDAELKSFALQGHEDELRAQTGKRVEVTGTVAPPPAVPRGTSGTIGTAAAQSGVPRLVVDSLKAATGSCSR